MCFGEKPGAMARFLCAMPSDANRYSLTNARCGRPLGMFGGIKSQILRVPSYLRIFVLKPIDMPQHKTLTSALTSPQGRFHFSFFILPHHPRNMPQKTPPPRIITKPLHHLRPQPPRNLPAQHRILQKPRRAHRKIRGRIKCNLIQPRYQPRRMPQLESAVAIPRITVPSSSPDAFRDARYVPPITSHAAASSGTASASSSAKLFTPCRNTCAEIFSSRRRIRRIPAVIERPPKHKNPPAASPSKSRGCKTPVPMICKLIRVASVIACKCSPARATPAACRASVG